jgi:hypothetical protein
MEKNRESQHGVQPEKEIKREKFGVIYELGCG